MAANPKHKLNGPHKFHSPRINKSPKHRTYLKKEEEKDSLYPFKPHYRSEDFSLELGTHIGTDCVRGALAYNLITMLLSRSKPGPAGSLGRRAFSWRARIALPLVALLAFLLVASVAYMVMAPGYRPMEAVYMTVITVSTLGSREAAVSGLAGQIWTILVIIGGLTLGTIALSLVGSMVVEGQVRRILGRRQLERKIASLSGHTIVCGLGKMGSMVVAHLREAGRDIVGIDADVNETTAAEAAHLLYVLGDATDEEILKAAGVERAGVLVATLATDADNVFVVLSAHGLNPKLCIVARAQQVASQDKLLRAGASRVVCPQVIGAMRISDILLRPATVDFFEVARRGVELELDELELHEGSHLLGKPLRELDMPKRLGVYVAAIRRADGQTIYQPSADIQLELGDVLILIGRRGSAAAVERL